MFLFCLFQNHVASRVISAFPMVPTYPLCSGCCQIVAPHIFRKKRSPAMLVFRTAKQGVSFE